MEKKSQIQSGMDMSRIWMMNAFSVRDYVRVLEYFSPA
jgi:hypothetical protein